MENISIGIDEIQKLLPHRYPMLLVDKVEQYIPYKQAVGIKNVTYNEWFFPGHFPCDAVMPGVLIVEAMAQTAGVLVLKSVGMASKDSPVYFSSIDNVRFRKKVVPGDVLSLHIEIVRYRGPVWKFVGKALHDSVVMAEAEFTAMIPQHDS